jgi:hypothetical protein
MISKSGRPSKARRQHISPTLSLSMLLRWKRMDSHAAYCRVCVQCESSTYGTHILRQISVTFDEPLNVLFITRPSIPVLQDATRRLQQLRELHPLVSLVLQLPKDEMHARSEPRQPHRASQNFVRGDHVSVGLKISSCEDNLA